MKTIHQLLKPTLSMKTSLVLMLLFYCFGLIQSQNLNFFEIRGSEHLEISTRSNLPEDSRLFRDWKEGYIIFDKHSRTKVHKINYDLRENLFYVIIDNELYNVHQSSIDTIVFVVEDKSSDEKLYNIIQNHKLQLVHQIVEGTYPIVKVYGIRISSTDINPILNSGVKDYGYKKESRYYILHNRKLISIPKKVKRLSKERNLPADLKKLINTYESKRIKDENDYISFGKFINSKI